MLNRIEAGQQQVDNKSVVVTCRLGYFLHLSEGFMVIILLCCSDGVHKSGLFCAVSIIVEALKTEQVVDVFKTIQALRLHNADFVSDQVSPYSPFYGWNSGVIKGFVVQEEYRFCYDLALKCVNSLRTKAI